MVEEYMERPGCRLFYRKMGKGPLLILIHGVACDGDYFRETAEILADDFTVLTYDRRGYSRSAAGEEADHSVRIQAEDAAVLIREQQLGPAFVAGCSAGSVVAAALGSYFPELVRALFLHEPAFAGDKEDRQQMDALLGQLRRCRENRRVTGAMLAFAHAIGGVDPRAKSKSLQQQARDLENLKVFLDRELDDFLQFDPGQVKRISCPVTVAAGTCDSEGLFCQTAKSVADRMSWNLCVVPGYHNFAADLPAEFAECLKTALDR